MARPSDGVKIVSLALHPESLWTADVDHFVLNIAHAWSNHQVVITIEKTELHGTSVVYTRRRISASAS